MAPTKSECDSGEAEMVRVGYACDCIRINDPSVRHKEVSSLYEFSSGSSFPSVVVAIDGAFAVDKDIDSGAMVKVTC